MNIEVNGVERLNGRVVLVLLPILLMYAGVLGQQEDVPTFKGERGSSIKIIDGKGKVKEELSREELKTITVTPKLSIPLQDRKTTDSKLPRRIDIQRVSRSVETNATIDEMLNNRHAKLRKPVVRRDRPPRKRR